MNPRYQDEARRIQVAKDAARESDNELLTPRAAAELFRKSPEAVRKAARLDHVRVAVDLWATDKSVPLIRLSSAIAYWGEPDLRTLEAMRENGHTLGDQTIVYNVLHPKPLLTLREPKELDPTG